MPQTSVTLAPVAGREGMIASNEMGNVVGSAVCEESGGIKPGRFVSMGTNGFGAGDIAGNGAILPAAAGDVTAGLLGVSMIDPTREPSETFAQYEGFSVLKRGQIWMLSEDACDAGAAVYVRHTAAGAEELGTVRSDADTADAAVAPGCRFETTTSGAGLILVSVNLP